MAYNAGFPMGYQPLIPQFPQFPQYPQVPAPTPQQAQPQAMTPPTVHADIVQVESEQAADAYPVSVGVPQMMIAKDDSAIFVKTAYANGQHTLDVYAKRPKAEPKPPVDFSSFVTWDALEAKLEAIQKRGRKEETKREEAKE